MRLGVYAFDAICMKIKEIHEIINAFMCKIDVARLKCIRNIIY